MQPAIEVNSCTRLCKYIIHSCIGKWQCKHQCLHKYQHIQTFTSMVDCTRHLLLHSHLKTQTVLCYRTFEPVWMSPMYLGLLYPSRHNGQLLCATSISVVSAACHCRPFMQHELYHTWDYVHVGTCLVADGFNPVCVGI